VIIADEMMMATLLSALAVSIILLGLYGLLLISAITVSKSMGLGVVGAPYLMVLVVTLMHARGA
jgi:hypothetical protein